MLLEKVSILYVEDDGEIREALAETLEFDVKELYVAENGEEGLKKFKEFKPDIVISDIKMPKMDGLQMSAQIKEISPKTPIIITTAFSDSDYLLKAIDIGIDKYVTKPVDIDKLYKALEEISSLLDKKGINQQTLDELPTKDSLIDNLKTIPGVSEKTIAAVISECGDLTRFPSIPKFIGYLGLFPTENSSGNSKSIGHLSKRGSSLAKHALYNELKSL